MEKKLCIGDIVAIKNSNTYAIVDFINYKNADGKVVYEDLLGKGVELSKIEDFSIIPNSSHCEWGWYKIEDISSIVESAERWADEPSDGEEDDDLIEIDRVKLEPYKTYKAVKIVYDTPFCGTTETNYYIFPDGIDEEIYDIGNLFNEDYALSHAESFGYGFEDYLEQNVDGYDPENSEDFDRDDYWEDYETSVMENCYYQEISVCIADGDLDDGNYFYVLTPDGKRL